MSADIEESIDNKETESEYSPDLKRQLKTQYRLFRRNLSAFLRYYLKRSFINVLYVTVENIPTEYILALQKQYPDKIIKVLTIHTQEKEYKANLIEKFEYSLKDSTFFGELYEYPLSDNNIQIYGISGEGFEKLKYKEEIYNFQYLTHFTKCVRIASKKLKAEIIHSENIPFLLGNEFNRENISQKLFQTFHHYPIYQDIEPFWAAINLSDNKRIKQLLKDKIIKKNLTALFGIKTPNDSNQIKNCLEYIYKNFEEFRNNVDKEEIVNENILIKRLNDRIIKMFPQAFPVNTEMFNPIYHTIKNSDFYGFNHASEKLPKWIENVNILKKGYINPFKNKIMFPINKNNFREAREQNKKYLIKEFETERIQTKFTDYTLFNEDSVQISGDLDYFYRGVLALAVFDRESTEEEIRAIALAVLKCFEQRKVIQIIFNIPKDFKNKYFESFIEFISTQKLLRGKWILIEGELNLPQFTSSADIILMPYGNYTGVENILYTSLKNGCIPVVLSNGLCSNTVTDIYDDMNIGCGFKGSRNSLTETDNENNSDSDLFTNTLFKALTFYKLNSAGWNRLVNNALEFDSGWNFKLVEQYNNIYDEIV